MAAGIYSGRKIPRRGDFGVEVSARRFRRGRFGTVAGLTLTWERRNVVVGNHHWSSLGTTSNPPWEPPLVFLGNHQWFFSGTTNGLPWEPPMVLLGNHQWSSLGTTNGPPWEPPMVLFGNDTMLVVENFCWCPIPRFIPVATC